jgi:hypothetical protein
MTRAGRPTRYTADHARQARLAYESGATDEDVAAFLGLHPDTLRRWRLAHPEFADAKAEGRGRADRRVRFSLYRRAVGYDYPEQRAFLPFGAKAPVTVTVTRHKHADPAAALRWLAIRDPAEWSGRAAPPDDKAGLAERLAQALANVAAGRAGDDNG